MTDYGKYQVIGFDLRRKPLLDWRRSKPLGEHWPTDGPPTDGPYPATITSATWPQSPHLQRIEPETNGINLMFLPDGSFFDPNAVPVAFTLAKVDGMALERGSYLCLLPEDILFADHGWKLLGYDVADCGLYYSGFYGFTWKPGEMAPLFAGIDLVFNRHGLIDDEAIAERCARIFSDDAGTKSHAPFYAVRVWAQIAGE